MGAKYGNIMLRYFQISIKNMLEFKTSNIIEMISSLLNTSVWLMFWGVFFGRFGSTTIWKFEYIFSIWASLSIALCLVDGLFSNVRELPQMIYDGRLEFFMLHPINLCFHLLIARMEIIKFVEGFIWMCAYAFFANTIHQFLIFLLITLLISILMLGYLILISSLSFFLKSSQGIVDELFNAFITFSTYPYYIFNKYIKIILFLIIPAGFISFVPIEILYNDSNLWIGITTVVGCLITILGLILFKTGLKYYEGSSSINQRVD